MKKIFLYIAITLGLLSCNHKDSLWQEVVEDLDERVETLEMLCAEMNTNITSLQTIVDVLQSNDFITSIVEIKKDGKVVGYTITFGKHDPITIYHGHDGKDGADGKDGKDGQNGADGKDGSTPVIGVAQDTDGVYYWTLNGEWLLDDNGNKLPVSGEDGKDGANGADGKDGQDGADGKDGITPLLKIENGYWYISYDNGATWTQLGKATGEDGKDGVDGADGKDGQDGDSMFQSVTQDENYVYFTLADGTVIKIAKASEEEQPNSEFMFIVTYDANGGVGTMQPDTFYYGVLKALSNNKYTKYSHKFMNWNTKADGSGISYNNAQQLMISKNIILYAQWEKSSTTPHEYVDLGLSVKWATCNVGASKPEEFGDYFAWGEIQPKDYYDWSSYLWCNGSLDTQTKYCVNSAFGLVDNKTTLDLSDDAAHANWGGSWRMPTLDELTELCNNCIWSITTKNNVTGYIVTSKSNGNSIFIPAAGQYIKDSLKSSGKSGNYWSCSLVAGIDKNSSQSYYIYYRIEDDFVAIYGNARYYGRSIRPVCP